MKIKKIFVGILALVILGTLTSCSLACNENTDNPLGTSDAEYREDSSNISDESTLLPPESELQTDSTGDTDTTPVDTSTEESTTVPPEPVIKDRVILLDAGHGFTDGGCTSQYLNGRNEKELTLEVVLKIQTVLEEAGYRVLLTHDGQSFLSLAELDLLANEVDFSMREYVTGLAQRHSGKETDQEITELVNTFFSNFIENNIFNAFERTYYANILTQTYEVMAFVSIHVNAIAGHEEVSGFSIDICADNDWSEESKVLMQNMNTAITKTFPEDKMRLYSDEWGNSYVVTKYMDMPSALVEIGYSTNPRDAANIIDPIWQQKMAQAISEGIIAFVAE